jgi:RNA 2',3'-cyclic 3'-phosphodiesterase
VQSGERIRLFCALCLPDDAVGALVRWQERELRGALPAGRIVARENLHVTLAFLGSRPAAELPSIAAALRTAAGTAGELRLRLRGYRETRSVGMLVFDDEGGRAAAFAADVQERLEELGVYRRPMVGIARPWLPHLTVLRYRERPHLEPSLPALDEVVPSDAAVYISKLRPDGARYEVLENVALPHRALGT